MERILLSVLGSVRDNPWAAILALLISISFIWAARERADLEAQVSAKADTTQLNIMRSDLVGRLDRLRAQNDTTNRMLRRFICRSHPHPDFCD